MNDAQKTTAFLRAQCLQYPALKLQDLYKALYQSTRGCGHLIHDASAAAAYIREEAAAAEKNGGAATPSDWTERLDGPYSRIHLPALHTGLTAETLARLLQCSAAPVPDGEERLREKLEVLQAAAESGLIPFSSAETAGAIRQWSDAGYPACHHSKEFREAYHPAYRVVLHTFAEALPLIAAIDRMLAERPTVTLAIEGGSASGKTTLAAWLAQIYGATVFHMDDFFLRPEQRTAERYAEPGGNVDRERFFQEVLLPLGKGKTIAYRRFDCTDWTLHAPVLMQPGRLNIIEGAYSMHPDLAEQYDLSVFLHLDSALQRRRILQRNTPEQAERFFAKWIPLETAYFAAMHSADRCTLILTQTE